MNSRVFSGEFMDELGSVERTSVPKKNDGAFEMPTKMFGELSDLSSPNASVDIEACVKSKTFSPGRDSDSGNSRYPGPASGDDECWSSSFDRPGSLDIGNKRESALIREGQAGSKPGGLFLYAAKHDVSSSGSLLPGAPWRAFVASDSSSPERSSDSTGSQYNNALGNSSELSDRYVSVSKGPSSNRLPGALLPRRVSKFSSADPIKTKDVLYWELVSAPCGPSSCSSGASAPRNLKKHSVPWLPNDKYGLVSASGRPDAAVFPTFGVCHGVS